MSGSIPTLYAIMPCTEAALLFPLLREFWSLLFQRCQDVGSLWEWGSLDRAILSNWIINGLS